MRETIRLLCAILIIAVILGICTNVIATSASLPEASSGPEEEDEETITISESAITIKVDETKTLTATSSDEEATITWESDTDTVATVTGGTVKGISPGRAVITAKGTTATAICTVTVEAKEEPEETLTWADFSKAKVSLTANKELISSAELTITDVKLQEDSDYYAIITSSNSKPDFVEIPEMSKDIINLKHNENDLTKLDTLSHTALDKYVELNQDLYLWVVERQYVAGTGKVQKFVLSGTKLTRYEEPKYSDAFFATHITSEGDQIVTKFTSSGTADRKLQIKIGKITDTSILKKIKNKDSSGFGDLMRFAKSNKGFYDKTSTLEANSYAIEYCAGTSASGSKLPLIDIGNELTDGAYYYLYVKADNENGKYVDQEAVTLATAQVFPEQKTWFMFFYGDEDFKWADFAESGSSDNTQMPGTLPQTGQAVLIPISVVGAISVAIFFARKYKKYEF